MINVADAVIRSNKKQAEFDIAEWFKLFEHQQELYRKAAQTQKFAEIELGNGNEPICILPLADTHIGSRGVAYDRLETITEEIISTPRLYVALVGDLAEFAVKLRSVAEICAQLVGPDKQVQFLEQWLDKIKHKLILATWCNHGVEREEKQVGVSLIKKMLASRTIMFDGIGHADIKVGQQVYKFAFSHKFRGSSIYNRAHAGQRYMRLDGPDREIAIMGDIHTPTFAWYRDGSVERLSLVTGTLNTESTYANRYFSIFTSSDYPCIELFPDEHVFVPFKEVGIWKRLYAHRSRIRPMMLPESTSSHE